MYAIAAVGGKQYYMAQGDEIEVEKTDELAQVHTGGQVTLKSILFVGEDSGSKIGHPEVEGASITATVVEHGKGKKIRVETYKRRKGYRKTYGHRQPYVRLKVDQIQA
jgi:large subunit ribosomal protein L21